MVPPVPIPNTVVKHSEAESTCLEVVPPVPIPNTVVKHSEAESTCLETGWEDRKLPVNIPR